MKDQIQIMLAYISAIVSVMFGLNFAAMATITPQFISLVLVAGAIVAAVGSIAFYTIGIVLSHKRPRGVYQLFSDEVNV